MSLVEVCTKARWSFHQGLSEAESTSMLEGAKEIKKKLMNSGM
jgi:hypothetical protein